MPLYWRYLLTQYLKVFLLSTCSLVAILLTTRLNDIAQFASLGSSTTSVLLFTWNQVPFILPIAVPLSCLISAFLLMQRLSSSYELTALRASGLSLFKILSPILIVSTYIALGNFYVTSEMATHSHMRNSQLKNEIRSINPLLLIQNPHLLRMKGIHFDTQGASKLGESAQDVVAAVPNKDDDGLNLIVAKQLSAGPGTLAGNQVTIVASPGAERGERVIENMGATAASAQDFTLLIKPGSARFNNDYFRFGLLRAKRERESDANALHRIDSEMVRRISMATAAFTFTLMGAAFGISIGRRTSSKGLFAVAILAGLYLFSFFAAKGLERQFYAAASLYIIPQIVVLILSVGFIKRVSKGKEA